MSKLKKLRNSFLYAVLGASFIVAAPASASDRERAIQSISNHFENVPTMMGEFIQFGPKGEQTGGRFYIKRPGKLHLDYEDPSPLKVVSNGNTLSVENSQLKTTNFYPLRKTPLSLLLSDEIDIDNKTIKSASTANGVTTVVMGNKSVFGDSEITLLFDPETEDLRQWTIKDPQGKETSVLILNVQKNVKIPFKYFVVKDPLESRR